jgi:DNA repair and recombination RAD54-like protein
MLVDRMSDENGSVDPNQYGLKDVLPLVFSFEDELEEREEGERELDELWADYDFAVESENIGRYRNDEVQWLRTIFNYIFHRIITVCKY